MSSSICSHLCINETPFQAVRQPLVNVAITFPKDSPWTKQCFRDECDINTIMSRYQSTGEMPVINEVAPQYLDVSSSFDFQSMQDQVIEARQLFMTLPSTLRTRFQNDPAAFIEYCADESNRPEMQKLGLIKTRQPDPIPQRSEDSGAGDKRSASEKA